MLYNATMLSQDFLFICHKCTVQINKINKEIKLNKKHSTMLKFFWNLGHTHIYNLQTLLQTVASLILIEP